MSDGKIYGIGDYSSALPPLPNYGSIDATSYINGLNSSNFSNSSNGMLGTVLSGGLGLVNSLFGMFSQHATNKAQKDMMREQMAWSEAQAAKQMNWQRDMWNAMNEYNTPANQRKRLEEAGINPALALGNVSTGSATSSPSGSQAQMPSSPNLQPLQFNLMDLIQSASAFQMLRRQGLENKALAEDVKAKQRENKLGDATYSYDKELKWLNVLTESSRQKLIMEQQIKAYWDAFYAKDIHLADIAVKNVQAELLGKQKLNAEEQNKVISETARQLKLSNDSVADMLETVDTVAAPFAFILSKVGMNEQDAEKAARGVVRMVLNILIARSSSAK